MKTFITTCMMTFTIVTGMAQQQAKQYPLRVYFKGNVPPIRFSFYDSADNKKPLTLIGVVNNDSITFLLPVGYVKIKCETPGKTYLLHLQKRAIPDTITFQSKQPRL